MADQIDYDIPVEAWVKVASNVKVATIYEKSHQYKYFRIAVDRGSSPPTSEVYCSGVPKDSIPMFQLDSKETILEDKKSDLYVTCIADHCNRDRTGKVTVDA